MTLHYSGILLDWIRQEKQEYFALLKELVKRGQVEIMGGGFYEPILTAIPREDALAQIKKMSAFVEEHLETRVEGLWLAERTFEPHLTSLVARAGMGYTVLDDAHFLKAGFAAEDLRGFYLTEEEGTPLKLFPINEQLRYMIPFKPPEDFITYCRQQLKAGGGALILADDGEKFGSWPGTKEHVYEKGWLVDFFDLLKENSSWLKTTTYRAYTALASPQGLVYLPTGSYREMMTWSGGFWKNFLVKYPESNHLHKKMLFVRQKVCCLSSGQAKEKAYDYLLAAQCNDAYWHGIFGGLYLNFLRHALYQNLLEAETIADRERFGNGNWFWVEKFDLDYDGKEEIVVSTEKLTLVFTPWQGGSLLEFSYKPCRLNLGDTLTRREEKYHRTLLDLNGEAADEEEKSGKGQGEEVATIHDSIKVKEKGLEEHLVYDSYRRTSFREHILSPLVTLADFRFLKFQEAGDFVDKPFTCVLKEEEKLVSLEFSRQGKVTGLAAREGSLMLTKRVILLKGEASLYIEYYLENTGEESLVFNFVPEFNFAFQAGCAKDRYYHIPGVELAERNLASMGEHEDLAAIHIIDEWQGLELKFQPGEPCRLWRLPLETISQSEEGLERIYQASVIMPVWFFDLPPGKKEEKRLLISLNQLKGEQDKHA